MLIKSVFKEILQWYIVETQAPPQAHSINFEGLDCLKCPNVKFLGFFFSSLKDQKFFEECFFFFFPVSCFTNSAFVVKVV